MKKLSIIVVIILGICNLVSANPISYYFISEPDSVFTVIDKSDRMDMVDYYNSGQKMEFDNRLGGKSKIEEMTADYMKVRLSDAAVVEMKMEVTGQSDTLLVVVKTVKAPAADSRLSVYNASWTELDVEKYFEMPQMKDFITSSKLEKKLLPLVEFPLISLEFSKTFDIEARTTVGDYMIEENFKEIKPYLTDKLVYRWNGKKFRLVK